MFTPFSGCGVRGTWGPSLGLRRARVRAGVPGVGSTFRFDVAAPLRNGPFHLVGYSSCSDAAERPRVNASAYHVTTRHAPTAVVAMPAANAP